MSKRVRIGAPLTHSALLSSDALIWSRFERSFSTSFGQKAIERISKVAALAGGASDASNQKETLVNIDTAKSAGIETHVSALRQNTLGRKPEWAKDLESILNIEDSGTNSTIRVISDLWWQKDGIDNFMSIKTVKPYIDQTAEAKRDLLKLKINDTNCNVYFGLYYNSFVEKEDYAWTPPKQIFSISADPVVLIGREYWDTLGGVGFYNELIEIASSVGIETIKKIQEHYGPYITSDN